MSNKTILNAELNQCYRPVILVGISTSIITYPLLDSIFTPFRHIYHLSRSHCSHFPQSLLLISTAHKLKYHLSGIVCLSVWISPQNGHQLLK